jgi:hypothetical protein
MSGNPEIHSHFGRILHRLTIAGTGSSQENSGIANIYFGKKSNKDNSRFFPVHPSPNFFIAGISFTTSGFDEDDDVFTDTTTNQVGVVSLTQRGKQPSMLHLSESHGSFLRTASTATLCSQNSSQNGGGSHALNNKPQWKELVLFGIQIENDQEEDATKDVGTSSSVITDDSKVYIV